MPRATLPEIRPLLLHTHTGSRRPKVDSVVAFKVLIALKVWETVLGRDVHLFCDKDLPEQMGRRRQHGAPEDGDARTDACRCSLESSHDNRDGTVPGRVEGWIRGGLVLDGGRKPPDRKDVDAGKPVSTSTSE